MKQLKEDATFEAQIHGMKMKAPMEVQEFDKKSDKALTNLAEKRYQEMLDKE